MIASLIENIAFALKQERTQNAKVIGSCGAVEKDRGLSTQSSFGAYFITVMVSRDVSR